MSEEMNYELLKATAEESEKDAEKKRQEQILKSNPDEYTPRPKSQRIWAWILLGAVLVGVVLWYYWIAKG